MYSQGVDIEGVLSLLRHRGFSKVASMAIVAELTRVPLADAKSLVHRSETWRDVREDHEHFHDRLEDATEELLSGDAIDPDEED